jgi:hypothetical protein
METVETKVAMVWSAAADAAEKGGAEPPSTDWQGLDEDLRRY